MARSIKINVEDGEFSAEYHEVGSTGFKSHESKVPVKYGNQLFNGEIKVEDPSGAFTMYVDGCHLVQVPEETGIITHMTKEKYAQTLGGPGSENED